MTCHAAFWAFSRVTCTTNFHTIPKRGFVAKIGRASPTSISFGFLNVNAVSEGAAKSETERPALELRKRSWTKPSENRCPLRDQTESAAGQDYRTSQMMATRSSPESDGCEGNDAGTVQALLAPWFAGRRTVYLMTPRPSGGRRAADSTLQYWRASAALGNRQRQILKVPPVNYRELLRLTPVAPHRYEVRLRFKKAYLIKRSFNADGNRGKNSA
ncbi:hypothetical protein BDP67DRAFT_494003 [Colletotrichum lupini]|nr:hypothetical protein BDP67DRAFT_494003 [Colletotrichum lupini]